MRYLKLALILISLILISGCNRSTINIDEDITLYERIALGLEDNVTSIHKFGAGDLDTTFSIISQSGTYQTPLTAQSLEFVSDDAGDTFLGLGAREITIIGINSSWDEQIITIKTNGTTPVQIPNTWFRVYRWYVSSSGTYAATGTNSYLGNLEIRGTGAGTTWTQITNTPITTGQSQIGAFTIPRCKEGYLISKNIFVDTLRPADMYFFFRENASDLTAPFNGTRRIIEREVGVAGGFNTNFNIPKGPFTGPADLGFFGAVSQGSGVASVEFELFLIDIC